MNTKTTAFLALVLAGLVVGLVFIRPQPQRIDATPKPPAGAVTQHDLFDKKPGDITKTVVQLKGKEPWVFEKTAVGSSPNAPAMWRMTTPLDFPVPSYEAERFGNELKRLQYEISYRKGEPGGPTDEAAGLAQPEAVVTLTDATNATSVVEIGKPVSENETYARLKGGDAIVVAKSNLRRLFKQKPLEYRDPQVFNYPNEQITRLEIVDRANPAAPVSYAFNKDGTKWNMESPSNAKASGKLDEIIRLLGRLRFAQWYEDGKDRLATFGLESAPIVVRLTIDEAIPVEKKDADADKPDDAEKKDEAPPEPKTKRVVRELHISDRSPIGDDVKVYARVDGESMVATLVKTTADKLRPKLSDLRDMHIVSSNTDTATGIDIQFPGSSATLALKDGLWSFQPVGTRADDAAVKELIRAIRDMNAIDFVDAKPDEITSFGFEPPLADVRLMLPSGEMSERISVGGYSDPGSQRVRYVRHNAGLSLAKVRVDDVAPLLRPASAYSDRTIAAIKPERLQGIKITLAESGQPGAALTFANKDGKWKMTAPVEADLREDRINKLVQSLAELKGLSVVGPEADASAFGLANPTTTLELTITQPSGAQSTDGPPADGAVPQYVSIAFAGLDGKYYARARSAGPPAIFEIGKDVYDSVTAELRTPDVFSFDVSKVKQFTVRNGDQRHTFAKSGASWTYQQEPALPLEAKKVDNLLLQIKDMKTEKYNQYGATDLAKFCLTAPQYEVEVQVEEAPPLTLSVSGDSCPAQKTPNHFAMIQGQDAVFSLTEEMFKRLRLSLGDLEKH